ncbi:hypothetical protein DRF65_10965 [Chryseobacterium pennae]|uniref:Glycolipid-binding domain-containing protein n=1 Tax=Chryseobacterium pennae TaxID=2258962 RepID=A0A3D9C8N6_9FLAO|nr:putative glycolipid-binding domain-containing protein [Chryseobacterium pennae]REC62227.1 hypothetical protein DRF65_10965 [Chryseobacterium pennae]
MNLIVWRGLFYKSWEHCKIEKQADMLAVESIIVGNHQGKIYNVSYVLKINAEWCVQEFEITSEIDGVTAVVLGKEQGEEWLINDQLRSEFRGLHYIDISVTPLTNSLPINNLHMAIGEQHVIDVLYIDILANDLKAVKQRYSRISKDQYLYENCDSDFSSIIQVDAKGIVKSYPGLFEVVAENVAK